MADTNPITASKPAATPPAVPAVPTVAVPAPAGVTPAAKPSPTAVPVASAAASARPTTLAATAKPAQRVAPAPKPVKAKLAPSKNTAASHVAVRGLRGSKADVLTGLASHPDLSAEEKTFAAAQVSKINGQAVHVDVHASAVGGAYVLHMHVRPLF